MPSSGTTATPMSSVASSLVASAFGVKYFTEADAKHLIAAVEADYQCTVDWSSSLYCGLNLDWNYEAGHVDVSMDGYIKRTLKRFQHVPSSTRTQHAPHQWQAPLYGRKTAQRPTSCPMLHSSTNQPLVESKLSQVPSYPTLKLTHASNQPSMKLAPFKHHQPLTPTTRPRCSWITSMITLTASSVIMPAT